ncbi:MAG: hypothetical protein M1814_003815 [Vezdaea aestivalis]|nr:MAG: hypothetical protein M1814_003815 [Vezdaea aestivalis]
MSIRPRASSASTGSSIPPAGDQELGSMYDYLAKIILLGPSGTGKSCLLHRFVKSEFRVLTSQTLGVEFASKIVRIGQPPSRKRIKLQLWDTAGTERFRSVSRSYYRGAAGALLIYDAASQDSLKELPTFLADARALAASGLEVVLVGNKLDLVEGEQGGVDIAAPSGMEGGGGASMSSRASAHFSPPSPSPSTTLSLASSSLPRTSNVHSSSTQEINPVSPALASSYASDSSIQTSVQVSALTGQGVDEIFARLARIILTKIELGDVDLDDPSCGIQYGDWAGEGQESIAAATGGKGGLRWRGRGRRGSGVSGLKVGGKRWVGEWGDVFRGRNSCC